MNVTRNFAYLFVTVLSATLLAVPTAEAATKCTAKVDRKTGVISISAIGVTGTAKWGRASGAEVNAFVDPGGCVQPGKINKCLLAAATSTEAKIPPPSCEIFVADGGPDTCSAFIAGCTPHRAETFTAELDPEDGTVYSQTGDWIDSTTYSSHFFTIMFKGGVFTEAPACTVNAGVSNIFGNEAPLPAPVGPSASTHTGFFLSDGVGGYPTCASPPYGVFCNTIVLSCTGR